MTTNDGSKPSFGHSYLVYSYRHYYLGIEALKPKFPSAVKSLKLEINDG